MNAAILHNNGVNIEELRIRMEGLGFKRQEIKAKLENDYRIFSKKKAFHCLCCDSPVEMVLPLDRNFHFRHWDKSECSYSENFKKYEKKLKEYEEPTKHTAGKAVIRTILEGQAKPLGLIIEPGYLYRSTLSIVPDFIIKHPNGELWAVDYLTGIRNNTAYSKNVLKRREIYEENKFKAHFFIDSEWIAYKSGVPFTTLVQTEIDSSEINSEDISWQEFINTLSKELLEILFGESVPPYITQSVIYINPTEKIASILRYVLLDDKNARLLTEPIRISLEKALTIDKDYMEFKLFGENENLEKMDVLDELHKELMKKEEKERVLKEQLEQSKKLKAAPSLRDELNGYNHNRGAFRTNEDIEKRVITNWGNPIRTHEIDSTATKNRRNREKEIEDKIFNRFIVGEAYILGGTRAWKEVILSEFEKFCKGEVGIVQLIKLLKDRGFTFSQPDKHIEHPIRAFVEHVAKVTKRDIKL